MDPLKALALIMALIIYIVGLAQLDGVTFAFWLFVAPPVLIVVCLGAVYLAVFLFVVVIDKDFP